MKVSGVKLLKSLIFYFQYCYGVARINWASYLKQKVNLVRVMDCTKNVRKVNESQYSNQKTYLSDGNVISFDASKQKRERKLAEQSILNRASKLGW